MRQSCLLCVLLGSLAWGQTAPGQLPPAGTPAISQGANYAAAEQNDDQPPRPPAPEVPMDATVLTIKGFCPGQKPASDSACQTTVTRAQFEALAAAVQPAMNVVVKRQLASLYPRLLVMSHEAETQGLDKEPQYQQMIAYARMQILNQALTRKLQEQAARISEAEVTGYYKKNLEMFQVYTLQRLFVPLRKQSPDGERAGEAAKKAQVVETPPGLASGQSDDAAEMTSLAERVRARAAAGEEFVKLQKEVFNAAGVKVESPNTSMGEVRRTSIPATQAAVLRLHVGEVSQLISDAAGHYIYKMEAKEQLTLDQVRDEVRGILIDERLRVAMDKLQNSYTTETNDAYFASTARPPHQGESGASSSSKKP